MANLTSNQVCNICCIHYNAGLRCCALGSLVEGGYLFNKGGRQAWIVACYSREVRRSWYCRADAVTVAEASNACGDWFVPSRTDLLVGHDCKSFWDSFSNFYWSNVEASANCAFFMYFGIGCFSIHGTHKTTTDFIDARAFRRVCY